MNKTPAKIISLVISLIVFAIYWYMTLPAFNLTDYYFLGGVILFALVYYIALVLLTEDADVVKTVPNIVIISVISILQLEQLYFHSLLLHYFKLRIIPI